MFGEQEVSRTDNDYTIFRSAVFDRDHYTCLVCREYIDAKLVAHHLDGYAKHVEWRIDPNNAVTLCEDCHKRFHREYGNHNNTRQQFENWYLKEVGYVFSVASIPF